MNILVLNGPNINLLGHREPEYYGTDSYERLQQLLSIWAHKYGVSVMEFQSNHEGRLVDHIQAARGNFDAIILNAAAYTHTSIAILDALKAVGLPAVEVHISKVSEREPFRQISYPSLYCEKRIEGHGIDGYRMAIAYLAEAYP